MLATRNMKLYLPFERNANDFSGNGNNGTVYGASLVDGGKFGKCYSFDGVDDYIAIPDSYDFHLTKFTVACWVYLDSSNTGVFFSSINSEVAGINRGFIFRNIVNGGLNVYIGYGATSSNYYSNYYLDLKTWTHVAATYDGSTLKMYANGEVVFFKNTSMVPQYFELDNNNVRIGAFKYDRSGLSNYFIGDIDDMAIFNKALTGSDIKRVMLGLHPLNG